MTRKDIEKAAIDYSGRDGGVTLKTEIYAFTAGAEWRINSVWHDASEHPITGEEALVKHITGDGEIKYRVDVFCGYEWKEMCHYDKLIQFAYVKDLIQNMEE